MVCVHCGHDTKVTNSRLQRRTNQVWRRRRCLSCGATFTTLEAADFGAVWLVEGLGGHLVPFSRDKLFLSLYDSCRHRPEAVDDATALSETVINKLVSQVKDASLTRRAIVTIAQTTLSRFDNLAGRHYQAFHKA